MQITWPRSCLTNSDIDLNMNAHCHVLAPSPFHSLFPFHFNIRLELEWQKGCVNVLKSLKRKIIMSRTLIETPDLTQGLCSLLRHGYPAMVCSQMVWPSKLPKPMPSSFPYNSGDFQRPFHRSCPSLLNCFKVIPWPLLLVSKWQAGQ